MDTSKKLGTALQEYGGKIWSIHTCTHTHTPTDTHTHTEKTNIRIIQHIYIYMQIARI